jgi:hypothetical protein
MKLSSRWRERERRCTNVNVLPARLDAYGDAVSH